jgi:autoinducer 2-degrading protein
MEDIMYTLTVTAHVLENKIEIFLQKTLECALATRRENGNVRYDILQNEDDISCFVIHEVYRTKEDFLHHRETPHSIKWKTEIESIMTKPRERIRCHSIYFSD